LGEVLSREASAPGNYFDIVCLHSAVVFVVMIAARAFLLQRFDFSPKAVFLLFGLSGLSVRECLQRMAGPDLVGLSICVWGLMVYPARPRATIWPRRAGTALVDVSPGGLPPGFFRRSGCGRDRIRAPGEDPFSSDSARNINVNSLHSLRARLWYNPQLAV
jgi:hypothetical protein